MLSDRRPILLANARIVDHRIGVGLANDRRDAARGSSLARGREGLAVFGAGLADEGAHVDESGRDQAAIAVNDLRTFRHASRMDATLCLADHAVSDQQVAGKIEIARGIDDPGVCEKDRAAV